MTVTTHIAEILRQGIWASLTGGWYYEPSHSVFCNTVHLYLWLILLVVPIVLGLSLSEFSWVVLAAYTSFIAVLFIALKLIVAYLHNVFDTSEPVITSKPKEDLDITGAAQNPPGVLSSADIIEMNELPPRRYDRPAPPSRLMDLANARQRQRQVRIHLEEKEEPTESAGADGTVKESEKADGQSVQLDEKDGSGKVVFSEIVVADVENSADGRGLDLPTVTVDHAPSLARKYSEPVIISEGNWQRERRRMSDGTTSRVRRAHSTFESRFQKGYELLSETSLEQARKNTNQSYPSKMCQAEGFPTLGKYGKESQGTYSTGDQLADFDMSDTEIDIELDSTADKEVAQYTQDEKWREASPRVFGPKSPALAGSSSSSAVVCRPGTPTPAMPTPHMQPDLPVDVPSSSTGWMPVVVSLNENNNRIERHSKRNYDEAGPSDGLKDIKGEITKFLEILIDTHPETLDVIENVRQSRLLGRAQRVAGQIREQRGRSSSTTSDMSFLGGGVKATHIANEFEDTTQGALHSFQDEDGNWWTYTFDETGVGTATRLGSNQTLMELIKREKAEPTARPRLDALPESAYASTDEEEAGPSTSQGRRRNNVLTVRRERALSSSSNESYQTYIGPLSMFHPASGAHANRTGSSRARHHVLSYMNSRLNRMTNAGERTPRSGELEQIMQLLDRGTAASTTESIGSRERRTQSVGRLQPSERIFRVDSMDSTSSSARRMLTDMGMGLGFEASDLLRARRPSTVKKSYYYPMKMFPKTEKSFKLKMDRLALAALLDRNRSFYSAVCDVFLACLTSLLTVLVLSTGLYYDLSLFAFAFVVAGAHFSLLKSVQPDASSPIHGFNWMVTYSRPAYFCFLTTLLITLHYLCDDPNVDKIPWNWNPYRLSEASGEMLLLAVRDLVALLILLLPVAFTLGWIPQVTTLLHHVLEQVEMLVFGGTASFGVFSASIQLLKSVVVWIILVSLCYFAFWVNPNSTQTPAFSAFLAATVGLSYLLSRFSSNTQLSASLVSAFVNRVRSLVTPSAAQAPGGPEIEDKDKNKTVGEPIPPELAAALTVRARHDVLYSVFISLGVFALHSTSMFTATKPYFMMVILGLCISVSSFNHYFYNQLRTHTPWKFLARPIFKSFEYDMFECTEAAKITKFEVFHVWSQVFERNLLYPLLSIGILCDSAWQLPISVYLAPLFGIRFLRGGFNHSQLIFVPLILSSILIRFDCQTYYPFGLHEKFSSEALFALTLFILIVLYPKWLEFYLKISFIMAYVAPWQISWGSAFHAFAQPFSVPHSALIWAQTIVSSIISAPLNPFLGSSFFMTSYIRPVKFWERDYNTKRSDASNTRLASQIDRGPMLDDSNLNAVFYEHLTRSLQISLAGDLQLGRWATSVQPGDCFILASDYLNCLVHIVEVGNGFVTFQLRGLEFRGTYCHQREVEAISENMTEGRGFCCCSPGTLPGCLPMNAAWTLRWYAWEVVAAKYVIDGYSITDNSAVNLLQVHELRRLLVTLYVKCIIYYATRSSKVSAWIANETIEASLNLVSSSKYVDIDHMFCAINDDDYDSQEGGISRKRFAEIYQEWITHCIAKRQEIFVDETIDPDHIHSLAYMLSLVGRRALGTAAHNRHSTAAESFLYGLHALFKGDFRIQCLRDEWVFADMDILRCVISPAVKMGLKLHQDHFAATDDFYDPSTLYDLISEYDTRLFISHEHDPEWRRSILSNTPSLLALRHMYDDGQDDYKIIMLNKMHLNMRVIKLNRECVRAFWAGQQQELIFLRNRNPERGSIQNARQVLRNMINSSADQPVGYPIYVSPLTTSFVDTHPQIKRVVGPTITLEGIFGACARGWRSIRKHLGPSNSLSVGQGGCAAPQSIQMSTLQSRERAPTKESEETVSQGSANVPIENSIVHMGSDGTAKVTLARRHQHTTDTPTSTKKTSTVETPPASVAKRASSERGASHLEEPVPETSGSGAQTDPYGTQLDENGVPIWVEITDIEHIFRYLNEPLKSTGQPLVEWPTEELRQMCTFRNWLCSPCVGLNGRVIYTWYPNHPSKKLRSHIGDKIYLVCVPVMSNALLAIGEKGVQIMTEGDLMEQCMHIVMARTEKEADSSSQGEPRRRHPTSERSSPGSQENIERETTS